MISNMLFNVLFKHYTLLTSFIGLQAYSNRLVVSQLMKPNRTPTLCLAYFIIMRWSYFSKYSEAQEVM